MNSNYDESNRFLGMLAEVAAQTLNSEHKTLVKQINYNKEQKELNKNVLDVQQIGIQINYNKEQKKLNKNILNIQQIGKLSDKQLVDSFSEFTSDEIRRVYSFKCYLIPQKCDVIFESFAAEDRARALMRDHLLNHIQTVDSSFTAETLSARNRRLNELNKNSRKSVQHKNYPKTSTTLSLNDSSKNQSQNSSSLTCLKKNKCLKLLDSQTNDVIDNQTHNNINSKVCFESETDFSCNNEKISIITSNNSIEDHCYTSLEGPVLKPNTYRTRNECVINAAKKCLNVSKVIATPAFPFVYEPVLPNISQIVELKSNFTVIQSLSNKINLNEFESKINRTINSPTNETTNTSQLKRLALQYINDIRIKNRGQTDGSSYSCKICIDKTFTSPTTLIYHYRSHAGVKPYECSLCKATFTRQHSLNYHMLIHLNKSRFMCEECGRNFRHPSHFKEHMRRHTGETPFECNECLIKFKTRNTYKRHLQTKHGKILTSKGIFDLPNSNLHLRKPCPPRRKYGLGFLHQNIEAVARYERAQEQVNQTIKDKSFSSKDNFEKLLQAVAIAEDDERSVVN